MAMDFSKNTYRPTRMDNRFRTSYALMSQWMNRQGSAQVYKREPLPATFTIAMQGNAAFPRTTSTSLAGPVNAQGAPPIYDTAKQAAIDENIPVHLRFSDSAGYDDFHKAYQQMSKQWPAAGFPEFGPPRLRHGRAGGSWRHVKEVLQAGGSRIVFVDGIIRLEDGTKIDDIPGGHLIQPKIEDIKSRHMMSARTQKLPSGITPDASLPVVERSALEKPVPQYGFKRWFNLHNHFLCRRVAERDQEDDPTDFERFEWALNQKIGVERNNWLIMR